MSRGQYFDLPQWAISAAAEVVRPLQSTRDAGLAIDGRYPYQTANWLFRTLGENLGEIRDKVIFSDVLPGFFAQTAIGTTGATFTNSKVCTGDISTSPDYFVAGLNTSASAYEVYGYTAGTPSIYSNGLPVALVVNDIVGDTSGVNKVMVIGASAGIGKAYRASAANTWTDVSAVLFSGVTGTLRKVVRMNLSNNGSNDYQAVVGDNGQVFLQNGYSLNAGYGKVTPPTGMATVNFMAGACALSGSVFSSPVYRMLFFGDSRHVMSYNLSTATQVSNALPVSLSAVASATVMENASIVVVAGSRTDGKGFIGYCTDKTGTTFVEIDPAVHGIPVPITELRTTGQGGLVALAGGTLYGGFPDDVNAWKVLSNLAALTDIFVAGNYDAEIGAELDFRRAYGATQIIVGIPGTTPVRLCYAKSRWFPGGRTFA